MKISVNDGISKTITWKAMLKTLVTTTLFLEISVVEYKEYIQDKAEDLTAPELLGHYKETL